MKSILQRLSFSLLALSAFLPLRGAHDPVTIAQSTSVGDGIGCFIPEGFDAQKTPSLAIEKEPVSRGALSTDWTLHPEFFNDAGHAGASLTLPGKVDFYGGGEVTGPLRRNGTTIQLWAHDNFNYEDGNGGLYQTHPWMMGVRPDGTAFGILFDTTWKSTLRTTDTQVTLATQGAPFRVFIIDRASPQAVVEGLSELTGKIPLPPRWALGYQQCRWSYPNAQRVREIADNFRSRQLPCDVIWMDIDYMRGFRIFTFDDKAFPDPKGLNDYLHAKQFHSVWMIDPGVKAEKGFGVFDSGNAADVWVKTAAGENYEGAVWPGTCVFPDFTRPETRAWWSGHYKDFLANGVDGVWNDMNEPAIFNVPTKTMPEDNQHRGGGDLPPGPHLLYHNAFGMLMVRATREGMLAARPETRPFVLSRSNYVGGQRYAAMWTGDNNSSWDDLKLSIPMCLTMGLSGQPFTGPDMGGFSGSPTPNLFGNWISMGTFFPFCRGHAAQGTPNKEPWAFGAEVEKTSRLALDRRYRLMPYLYTLFQQSSVSGLPVMRPMLFADPTDGSLRQEQQAFLVGSDLMVVPKWARGVAMPKGIWDSVSLVDGDEADPLQVDLKIRGGSIIPLGKVIQSTNEESLDPLTLLVCLDENGKAAGNLYEDAGNGFQYTKGDYVLEHFVATTVGGRVGFGAVAMSGNMKVPERTIRLEIVNSSGVVSDNLVKITVSSR